MPLRPLGEFALLVVVSFDSFIGEHLVGLVDFLKCFLLALVGIRVVLLCQLPEGFLDVLLRCRLGHVEDLVVVFRGVEGLDGTEIARQAETEHAQQQMQILIVGQQTARLPHPTLPHPHNIQLMSEQQDQQITFKYLFIITPLQIKSNSKIKSSNPKAILIKLGNKTAKCTQMNTPLQLEIDVLYSKTLQKYCPIKGIIKIYDIAEDGSEIISCVGGFQTDELLNDGKNNVVIEKELGTSKLKMDINIINKSEKKGTQKTQGPVRPSIMKESSSSREKYLMTKKSPTDKPTMPLTASNSTKNIAPPPQSSSNLPIPTQARKNSFTASQGYAMKNVDIPFKNTSSNISKSIEKINQALGFKRFEENPISTKANEVLSKAEIENLKQQLNDEKRKAIANEEKLNKTNMKVSSYKSALLTFTNQSKTYYQIFKKLLSQLQLKDSKPQLQLSEPTKTLSLKYKDKSVEKTLHQLLSLATRKVRDYIPFNDTDLTTDKDRNLQQFQQYKKEVSILKKLTMQKDKKIYSLQKQLQGIETTIHNLKQTNKHLSEQNNYLREKNDQIEMNLYHKQVNLENLRKDLERCSYENQQLDNKLYNAGLQMEELKEEVDNCNETIEQYREKYGDLKNVKNRAIEMQIKECIRWIDQQNRDLQMSEMEETMQSSEHKDERDDSLSSVIRNIELEKVPVEEMSIIRDELVRILKKIDNLMIK